MSAQSDSLWGQSRDYTPRRAVRLHGQRASCTWVRLLICHRRLLCQHQQLVQRGGKSLFARRLHPVTSHALAGRLASLPALPYSAVISHAGK